MSLPVRFSSPLPGGHWLPVYDLSYTEQASMLTKRPTPSLDLSFHEWLVSLPFEHPSLHYNTTSQLLLPRFSTPPCLCSHLTLKLSPDLSALPLPHSHNRSVSHNSNVTTLVQATIISGHQLCPDQNKPSVLVEPAWSRFSAQCGLAVPILLSESQHAEWPQGPS